MWIFNDIATQRQKHAPSYGQQKCLSSWRPQSSPRAMSTQDSVLKREALYNDSSWATALRKKTQQGTSLVCWAQQLYSYIHGRSSAVNWRHNYASEQQRPFVERGEEGGGRGRESAATETWVTARKLRSQLGSATKSAGVKYILYTDCEQRVP